MAISTSSARDPAQRLRPDSHCATPFPACIDRRPTKHLMSVAALLLITRDASGGNTEIRSSAPRTGAN